MFETFLVRPIWLQQLFLILISLIAAALLYYLLVAVQVQQHQIQFKENQQVNYNIQQLKNQISNLQPYRTLLDLNTNFIRPEPHDELLNLIHLSNNQLIAFNQVRKHYWQINCLGEYQQLMKLVQQVSQASTPLIIEKIELSTVQDSSLLDLTLDINLKE